MAKHVCPWWVGYLLVSPIRRWFQDPEKILSPYINEGMTVLDIGPGMGFFTIPAARMVGDSGRVIAVDLQDKMLKSLVKRAEKAGVAGRIVTKLCEPDNLGVSDLIDLCLALTWCMRSRMPAPSFLKSRQFSSQRVDCFSRSLADGMSPRKILKLP